MCEREKQQPVLEARQVTKRYPAAHGRTLTACENVSLSLYAGQTLGIVGESGCGKSTFLRLLVGLEKPDEGEILFHGEKISGLKGKALREARRHIQMVFQDPTEAFHPKMKIKDVICEPLLNYHLIRRGEVSARARELLRMVELPEEFAERYPKDVSGGQRQRVGIARALALEPDVLLCDEATSALDVAVQRSVVELLVRLQKKKNIAIAFICHDLALVQQLSHRVAVMYLGHVVELMDGADVASHAMNPYTQAMLDSVFDLQMDFTKQIKTIAGEAPSPLDIPDGCPFQNRCGVVQKECANAMPPLLETEKNHFCACFAVPPIPDARISAENLSS